MGGMGGGGGGGGKGMGPAVKAPARSSVRCSMAMDAVLQGIYELGCLPGQNALMPENCVQISGLPPDCTEIMFYQLLSPFGSLCPQSIILEMDEDGKCKGEGFANFVDPEPMMTCEETLHGYKFGTTQLTVRQKGQDPKPVKSRAEKEGVPLGDFTGVIKSFNEVSWYGFIECMEIAKLGYGGTPQSSGDCFLTGDEKKEFTVGQQVHFSAFLFHGKPQALHLKARMLEAPTSMLSDMPAADAGMGAPPGAETGDVVMGSPADAQPPMVDMSAQPPAVDLGAPMM